MGDSPCDLAPRFHPLDLRDFGLTSSKNSTVPAGFVRSVAERARGHHQLGLGTGDLKLDGRERASRWSIAEATGRRASARVRLGKLFGSCGRSPRRRRGPSKRAAHWIDSRDDAFVVEGHDACGHVAEQGLGLLAAAFELGGGGAQIGCHLVEGIDQGALFRRRRRRGCGSSDRRRRSPGCRARAV